MVDNKFNGLGRHIEHDGSESYVGYFLDGKEHGNGRKTFMDPAKPP